MSTQAGHFKPAVDPRVSIEYWSVTSSFFFFISVLSWPYFSRTWWKFHMNWFMVAHPIEISVNWPVHNCLEPGQFTLISMGLIRYSWDHIFDLMNWFPTHFGCGCISSRSTNKWSSKYFNAINVFCDVITCVLYREFKHFLRKAVRYKVHTHPDTLSLQRWCTRWGTPP